MKAPIEATTNDGRRLVLKRILVDDVNNRYGDGGRVVVNASQ